jgi:inorganic pyrophosphatase
MLLWKNISPVKKPPETLNAIIECPQGSKTKYELSKKANVLLLDRPLHSSVMYPHDYGLIPGTLSLDGDPLDILVLSSTSTIPLTVIQVKPIGMLIMEDEKGLDEKILSVAISDPVFGGYESLIEVPMHYLKEITEFFRTYKNLEEPKYAIVKEWKDKEDAYTVIMESIDRFNEKYGSQEQINPF